MSSLTDRLSALPAPGLDESLRVERGSSKDYGALAEHHYRAHRPGTILRVLALRHHRPTVVGRFLARTGASQTVGVLVESLPSLACALRDAALGRRYGSVKDLRLRSAMLRRELRCISRVVVHPQWRGLGLAVRLVRHALEHPVTPLTEALAAMGHVNPFFERAGMTAYRRAPHRHDDRLVEVLRWAGFSPVDLALLGQTLQRIDALPEAKRRTVVKEACLWFCRTHRSSRTHSTLRQQLEAARTRLLCEPVYYLKDNRAEVVEWPSGRVKKGDRDGHRDDRAGSAPRAPGERERDGAGALAQAQGAHRPDRPLPADHRPADRRGVPVA